MLIQVTGKMTCQERTQDSNINTEKCGRLDPSECEVTAFPCWTVNFITDYLLCFAQKSKKVYIHMLPL